MNRILKRGLLWLVPGCLAAWTGAIAGDGPAVSRERVQGADDRVAVVTGLSGPEAVRYDPAQDIYFVSNFNGEASGDANGFISKVAPDGTIEALDFMEGTARHPLHGPRGMQIVGDTLWVADAEGIHGFDRRSGEHTAFVDFTGHDPGFLNDIDAAPDGSLYVTDTGNARVFRVRDGAISVVASKDLAHPPNGITWFGVVDGYVLAPWGEGRALQAYRPGDGSLHRVGEMPGGGNFDGVEVFASSLLIASQVDQAIWAWRDGKARRVIETPGRPADIGIDTKRKRIAVPYIALDRVDIWQLPDDGQSMPPVH